MVMEFTEGLHHKGERRLFTTCQIYKMEIGRHNGQIKKS